MLAFVRLGIEQEIFVFLIFLGNYTEKCPVRIWKRYILLLIDLLISNNFSSITFFANTYFYELSVSKYTTVNRFF